MGRFYVWELCRGQGRIEAWPEVQAERKIRLEKYVGANIIQTQST